MLRRSTLRMVLYTELLLLDSIAILLAFYIAACSRGGNWLSLAGVNVGIFLLPITLGTALASGTYTLNCLRYPVSGVKSIFSAFFFSVFVVLLGSYLLTAELPLSRFQLAEGALLALSLVTICRLGFRRHVRAMTGGTLLDELVIVDGVSLEIAGDAVALDARIINLSPNPRDPQMLHRLGTTVVGFDRVIVA